MTLGRRGGGDPRSSGSACSVVALLAVIHAASASPCPFEPLQALGDGGYAVVDSKRKTTCKEHSDGACPYAVPFPDFPCLVNCVASKADCIKINRATPAVDKYTDPLVCTSCGIMACEECEFVSKGSAVCLRCFNGFIGVNGPDGQWKECVLWDHSFVLQFFSVLLGLVFLLFFLVLVAVCLTAYKMTCGAILQDVAKRIGTLTRSVTFFSSQAADPLLSDLDYESERNRISISKGLMLNLQSSIKASTMRQVAAENRSASWCGRLCGMIRGIFDDRMADLGMGLQLFFKTQIFLIVVAAIVYMAATSLEDKNLFQSLRALDQCAAGKLTNTNVTNVYADGSEVYFVHAKKMQFMCSALWLVLIVITWGFHVRQKDFIEKYDKSTHSAEDYTLRLDSLPVEITSEKALKGILEHEWRMPGKIYGVSICYDIRALEKPERIKEMVDNIIEDDDVTLGWVDPALAREERKRKQRLEEDRKELETMLTSGKLRGSGTAYVVFRYQTDMARVKGEHRGISDAIFRQKVRHVQEQEPASGAPHGTVQIAKDTCEPAGLLWFLMWTPQALRNRRKYFELPLRMIAYIGTYAMVAQLFFWSMIKPWQDNFIEGADSASSVKVISKLVLLFNFGIQTLVMIDVQSSGFSRVATVDMITFVWNTALLLVTNAYVFMQDCFREGIRWDLSPPVIAVSGMDAWWEWQRTALQSARIEKDVGISLVGTMTDQIMMLYVLGEVANVLLPVMANFLAIRFIYLYRTSRDDTFLARIQKRVREILIGTGDGHNITVRQAERQQPLVPLLLWMEYTYIVIFPAMAFITFYLLTDENSMVCGWLLGFSVIFFIWQRYVMLWLYGKSTYDSSDSYDAFILMWGVVLSMLPPASIWWAWRLGEISEAGFAFLTMVLVYFLSLLSYEFGLIMIDAIKGAREDGVDDFGEAGDPGYGTVIQEHGMSWWNLNPVYVLKQRHCPRLQGHEVLDDDDPEFHLWPKAHVLQGFFEAGKEFKHTPNDEDPGAMRRYCELMAKRKNKLAAKERAKGEAWEAAKASRAAASPMAGQVVQVPGVYRAGALQQTPMVTVVGTPGAMGYRAPLGPAHSMVRLSPMGPGGFNAAAPSRGLAPQAVAAQWRPVAPARLSPAVAGVPGVAPLVVSYGRAPVSPVSTTPRPVPSARAPVSPVATTLVSPMPTAPASPSVAPVAARPPAGSQVRPLLRPTSPLAGPGAPQPVASLGPSFAAPAPPFAVAAPQALSPQRAVMPVAPAGTALAPRPAVWGQPPAQAFQPLPQQAAPQGLRPPQRQR